MSGEPLAGSDEAVPKAMMFVPPVAAAGQLAYKPAKGITSTRRCAWAPFCKLTVDKCGGLQRNTCNYRDQFRHVTEDELKKKKTDMRNEEKKKRAVQKRQEKQQAATKA